MGEPRQIDLCSCHAAFVRHDGSSEHGFTQAVDHRQIHAIYLSFVVTSTIGFGEYYPVTGTGKLVVAIQSLFYLSYIALFISFFNRGGSRGYFENLK